MQASLIVAAGGSGTRFQKSLADSRLKTSKSVSLPSKLFFLLNGKPLLAHTLSAFQDVPEISETVVALPREAEPVLRGWIREHGWKKIKLVRGGRTRSESVFKALQKTDPRNAWVMVHDGARPFVSRESLKKLFSFTPDAEGVLLAKKVVPTIKEADASGLVRRTVDRNFLFEAETPQLVRREVLKKAYRTLPGAMDATDEASLLEALKAPVKIVASESWNPKITTHADFRLAEAYLSQNRVTRTGFGRDTHRLVKGRKLMLGGIQIPFAKGTLGHSDGDALLHAVSDAVLGVLGAGDIGEWFSDKNPKNKNLPSSKILLAVMQEAGKRGWKVEHVDSVVILEKPKLGEMKKKVRAKLAALLGLDEEAVSVKAKTAEGLGPEGEGLAVTCEALVTMGKIQ